MQKSSLSKSGHSPHTPTKEFDAFLSFAEPDRELADALRKLLAHVRLSPYFAAKIIPARTPEQWQSMILQEGIQNSHTFILICTRESLTRPWVLFEAGAAAAFGVRCYCTRVEGVSDSDIRSIPDPYDLHHYRLHNENDLQDLLTRIAEDARGQAAGPIIDKINDLFAGPPHVLLKRVLGLASARWAFIAGNVPTAKPQLSVPRQRQMREFVKQLTSNLLRAGISITACPQVEPVGKVALLAAEAYVSRQEKNESAGAASDYEIGGIYPIDHKLRDLPLSIAAKSKWREHLMNFRKSYLEKQEWLILVGGSHGTREECEAATILNEERKAKIKIYPIPCFGGTAAKIFVSLRKAGVSYLDPCLRCKRRQYPCRNLDAIVEKIRSM